MDRTVLASRYRVAGMDCAACAKKIDTAVRRVVGVEDVNVSVTAGTMTITHLPTANMEKLAKRVEGLGYKLSPVVEAQTKVAGGVKPTETATHANLHHKHDHAGHDHADHGHGDHDHDGHDHASHDHDDHGHEGDVRLDLQKAKRVVPFAVAATCKAVIA